MNVALVLAGGTGSRVGKEIPKQYIEVAGRPVIYYCIETLTSHTGIDVIQIVAEEMWHDFICQSVCTDKLRGFSAPGENRQLSILNGLEDIRKFALGTDQVVIHDAVRPLLTNEELSECLSLVEGYDGVLPVLPMKDTVYASLDGKAISGLLNRNQIFAGQAPERFVLGKYYEANVRLLPEKILHINGSAEPAIMAGMDIMMISGDERNFKITTREDLVRFQQIIEG